VRVSIFSQSSPPGGGHASDSPNQVCAPHTLKIAALELDRALKLKPPAAAKKQ
jgi:hypothetical protein